LLLPKQAAETVVPNAKDTSFPLNQTIPREVTFKILLNFIYIKLRNKYYYTATVINELQSPI